MFLLKRPIAGPHMNRDTNFPYQHTGVLVFISRELVGTMYPPKRIKKIEMQLLTILRRCIISCICVTPFGCSYNYIFLYNLSSLQGISGLKQHQVGHHANPLCQLTELLPYQRWHTLKNCHGLDGLQNPISAMSCVRKENQVKQY